MFKKKSLKLKPLSTASTYSIIPTNEFTQGALDVWQGLPKSIRQDPSLAPFREHHEKLRNDSYRSSSPQTDDDLSDDESDEAVSVGLGQMKPLDVESNKLEPQHHVGGAHKQSSPWFTNTKIGLLLVVWVTFTLILMLIGEKVIEFRQLAVPVNLSREFILTPNPANPRLGIILTGPFSDEIKHDPDATNYLLVDIQLIHTGANNLTQISRTIKITETQFIAMVPDNQLDTAPQIKQALTFHVNSTIFDQINAPDAVLRVRLRSNHTESIIPLFAGYDPTPIDKSLGVILSAIVLLLLYVLIIWELVHRTFAMMIASTMSLAILALMGERPTMTVIMSWIDVETLLLLFGMMIMVAIISETGVFDYLAVFAYKITNGRVWPLINCLCVFTAIVSSFLDNVTTVLLMTPVSIRLCEVMALNPVPILMAMVICSNVGGAATPVGEPPNVIIASNPTIAKSGVHFLNFTLHMTAGIILVMIQTLLQLRFQFRDMNSLRFGEPPNIQDIRHQITIWQRAASSLSTYSKDEDLVRGRLLKKVSRLERQLKKELASGAIPTERYKATLEDLQTKYPIRNKALLIKCAITLVFTISFFFMHSLPVQHLSLSWTALMGAILLLILADREDIEVVLSRVEWSTLLFFAALFIMMESMVLLGLIEYIGKQIEFVIISVDKDSRLAVAILLILWVSSVASGFVDNIPLNTMMVRIAISLSQNKELGLPLQPLVWALAFGAGLGANGTLIGSSSNIVCAGVAEQHGYKFTFMGFFKLGFPLMIGSVIVSSGYLLLCHCVFEWHTQ